MVGQQLRSFPGVSLVSHPSPAPKNPFRLQLSGRITGPDLAVIEQPCNRKWSDSPARSVRWELGPTVRHIASTGTVTHERPHLHGQSSAPSIPRPKMPRIVEDQFTPCTITWECCRA